MTASSPSPPEPPLWSVLIATLAARRELLAGLLEVLLPQCEADGRVEVVGCWDTGGRLPAIRAALLAAAAGRYVSFFDDDDLPDPEFIRYVTTAMTRPPRYPDFIAFDHSYYVDGAFNARVRTGLQYDRPRPGDGTDLIRPVTHVNPVRRQLTGGVTFGPAPGEDGTYVLQVWPRLRTQAIAAGRPLYHYRHSTHDSVQRAVAPDTGLPRLEVDSPCFRWIEAP
jgi:hypothetical protein